jgi:hypothetical protein
MVASRVRGDRSHEVPHWLLSLSALGGAAQPSATGH